MDTDDEMLRHKREKLRKLLLDMDSSPTLWGERVKVKIGMNTIKAKDLGAFLVENSSSIHICLTNETGGHLGDSYVVLQEVEKYLENLRKRHLLPSSDYSGWKFGCIYS